MVAILTIVNLLRGDGRVPSVVGVSRCDNLDYGMLIFMLLSSIFFSFVGIFYVIRPSYQRKVTAGYQFVDGDFECTPSNSVKLTLIAFFGSIMGTISGSGTGYIFNPVLISLGLHP